MLSEKVTRILKSRGVPLDQLSCMSEVEAWDFVYSTAALKKEKPSGLEICFTGFADSEKVELSQLAASARLRVATSVTKTLSFLCAGENAGPAKLAKAKVQNAIIFTRKQFEHFLQTGEVATQPGVQADVEESATLLNLDR